MSVTVARQFPKLQDQARLLDGVLDYEVATKESKCRTLL